MNPQIGPPAQALASRLAECPPEFLNEPVIGGKGSVHTAALVSDVFLAMGRAVVDPKEAGAIEGDLRKTRTRANRLRIIQLACWLLAHPWFQNRKELCPGIMDFLSGGLEEVAGMIDASLFVSEQDRREELVRLLLTALKLTPEGETRNQAADRLESLNSVLRHKVLEQTKEAEARAKKVREDLAKKAAAEAAAKATRE